MTDIDTTDSPRVGAGRGYIIPPAGRAALLNAAADAHRMAQIGATPRADVSEEDLAWYMAEPQATLRRELYVGVLVSARFNAIGHWLRALAGGD